MNIATSLIPKRKAEMTSTCDSSTLHKKITNDKF